MYHKYCEYCKKYSHSASNHRDWICPYCKKKLKEIDKMDNWEEQLFNDAMNKAKNGDLESSTNVMAKMFKMYYDALLNVGFDPYDALDMVIALQNTLMGGKG